jgi:hypothetical protein
MRSAEALSNGDESVRGFRQLRPRLALNAAYIRRGYGNFTVTENLLRTPADYNPYCLTAPLNAGLPGGGGNQICGCYDVKPRKFSATTNNLVTFASRFGTQTEVYDGFDLSVSARTERGVIMQGGLNSGRTSLNNCFVFDSPQPTVSWLERAQDGQVSLDGAEQAWIHASPCRANVLRSGWAPRRDRVDNARTR